MDHRCLEPLELAALLAMPADDPRRRDADACPRCDSLLRGMAAFLDGDADLPNDEKVRAERHLAGVLAGAMAAKGEPAAGSVTSAATDVRRTRSNRRSPRGQGWGWGLGLAAAAAGVMFFVAREPSAPAGPSGVLRGGAPNASMAGDLIVTVAAGPTEGQLLLSWPAVAGADSYVVELFTAELDTLAVLGPVTELSVTVAATLWGAGGDAGSATGVLCRVRASGRTGPVADSRLTGLPRP